MHVQRGHTGETSVAIGSLRDHVQLSDFRVEDLCSGFLSLGCVAAGQPVHVHVHASIGRCETVALLWESAARIQGSEEHTT